MTINYLWQVTKRQTNAVVKLLSHVQLCDPMNCSTPGFLILYYLLEFTQIHTVEPVMLSNHLTLCHPLLLLPSVFPSITVFSNESTDNGSINTGEFFFF